MQPVLGQPFLLKDDLNCWQDMLNKIVQQILFYFFYHILFSNMISTVILFQTNIPLFNLSRLHKAVYGCGERSKGAHSFLFAYAMV